MLRNINQSASGKRILGVPQVGILAAQIASQTATGDHGPGILYNEAMQAEYVGKYLRARLLGFPPAGTLFVHENGAYEASGLPDGTHVFAYALDVDAVAQPGTADLEITVGVTDATAAGATLTGSATLTTGNASGQANATAPGTTLSGNASLIPGAANGAASGSAPGTTLNNTATLTPGAATGQSNAIAPGVTLSGSATITPGAAQAINGGSAPGANLAGNATLSPGSATGQASADAPGTVLTGSATINPGSASGDLHASAPGSVLTVGASLITGHASNGEASSTLSTPRLRTIYAGMQSRRLPAVSTFFRPRNVQR